MKKLGIIILYLLPILLFAQSRVGIDPTGTNVVLSGPLDLGINQVTFGGETRTNWPTSGVATSGVVSISATGAVSGVITFSGSGVTQTNNNFNFSGGEGLWEIDIFGRLVPTIDGVTDSAWELVENRIVPK